MKEVNDLRILLAEDEKALSKVLKRILEKSNYTVDAVYNGDDALELIREGNYDAAVLDIMMPKMDGITVLKKLRESGNRTPVIMLTAKSEIEDKVLGLDSGANDYLTKPFDSRELLARIRSITRSRSETDSGIKFGNVTLNRASYELSTDAGKCRLNGKEYQIMERFMMNPHCVISVNSLIEKVWGYENDVEVNTVWVYISNIRKKLNDIGADIEIKAMRNAGYSLENADD